MRFATLTAALALAAAAPAFAQDPQGGMTDAQRQEASEGLRQLDAHMALVAEQLGIEIEPFAPILEPLIEQANRQLPAGDDYDFDVSYNFDFLPLKPTTDPAEIRPIHADAQACAAATGRRVIRFERLTTAGGQGHRCVTTGAGDEADQWTLTSDTLLRLPDRQIGVQSGGVAAADDPARAAEVIALQADALTEVAVAFDGRVIDAFLKITPP